MKVAIVGAGICGLYLAWKLAERGEEVSVFEKRDKIGKEACSGLVSRRILDFIPESENLIKNRIDSALIHFPGKTVKLRFSREFFVLNHSELDQLALSRAERSGAQIFLDNNLGLIPEGFSRVIGCDGALSSIRENLGIKNPQFRLGIMGFAPVESRESFVETWATPSGFLWKIPRGEETEYGVFEKPETAKNILDDFLKEKAINLKGVKMSLIPQGLMIPENNSVTLCGDAAGLTKPWSGGGIIWGLKAADMLLKNFPNFLEYQKELKRFFLPKILFSKIAGQVAYFLGFNAPAFLPKNIKIESDFII